MEVSKGTGACRSGALLITLSKFDEGKKIHIPGQIYRPSDLGPIESTTRASTPAHLEVSPFADPTATQFSLYNPVALSSSVN